MEPVSKNFNPQEIPLVAQTPQKIPTAIDRTAIKINEIADGFEGISLNSSKKLASSKQVIDEDIPDTFQSTLKEWIADKILTSEEADRIFSKLEAIYNKPFPKISKSILKKVRSEAQVEGFTPGSSPDKQEEEGSPVDSPIDIERKLTLLRGCRADQLLNMLRYDSAGGVPANKNAIPPSEKECQSQVGEEISLPEFTYSEEKSNSFGTGSYICAVKIASKYLGQGSEVESGEVANPDAPIEIIAVKKGRGFIGGVNPITRASNTGSNLPRGGLSSNRIRLLSGSGSQPFINIQETKSDS